MLLSVLSLLLVQQLQVAQTYTCSGPCHSNRFPLQYCQVGTNISAQLIVASPDNVGFSPFNIPDGMPYMETMLSNCWKLRLNCTEQLIRITVSCNCPGANNRSMPLTTASQTNSLIEWQLHHFELLGVSEVWPIGSHILITACYDWRNGSCRIGLLGGISRPDKPNNLSRARCNYFNEVVFQRFETKVGGKNTQEKLVLMAVVTLPVVGLLVVGFRKALLPSD